jgi:opacity protein-like surface antigen
LQLCGDATNHFASFQHRFYANIHGGWVFSSVSDDVAFDTDPTTGPTTPNLGPTITSQGISKPGYVVGAAIGREFDGGFRFEGELNYSNASIDHVHVVSTNNVATPADIPATGSGSSITDMFNAFLSASLGPVTPYVGGGAGIAYFTANNIVAGPATLKGSDWGLAYQLIAGADFAATQNISVGARYRYVRVTDLSLMDGGYKHDFSTTAQSVEFVLTNHFGN